MKEDIYIPSTWGMRYHSLTVDEALGAGAAGPGKSLVLLMDPLKNVMMEHERCVDKSHPARQRMGSSKGRCLHLRRNYKMLTESIDRSKRFFPRVDPKADFKEGALTWTFQCGYKYEFGHCQNPGDWMQYQSREFDVICIDELTQFEKAQYDGLCSRCRAPDDYLIPFTRIRCMSNPLVRQEGAEKLNISDPFWVRKRFVDPCPEGNKILYRTIKLANGKKVTKTRIYLPATLKDNPSVEFREAYEATLRNLPEHLRKIMLEGDWYYQVGSYFGDVWDPRIHIMKPFAIPASWRRFRAMDWGYKTSGVIGWFALSEDNELFMEREYNFLGKSDIEVARRVIEIEQSMELISKRENESHLSGPADTQLWDERGESGKSKAAVFLEKGVRWEQADKKNRAINAERVHARLADHGNGTKTPGLVFFSNCTESIKTIPALQADPSDPSVPLKGGPDHWYDMVSYAVAYASYAHRGISQDDIEERSDRKEQPPEQSRGTYGYGY